MEHRWGSRIQIDRPLLWASQVFGERIGRLSNLSLSGALVKVDFDLRPLTRVSVMLELGTPRIDAYVTRRTSDAVGIEWCEFAPRPVADLLRVAMPPGFRLLRWPDPPRTTTSISQSPI